MCIGVLWDQASVEHLEETRQGLAEVVLGAFAVSLSADDRRELAGELARNRREPIDQDSHRRSHPVIADVDGDGHGDLVTSAWSERQGIHNHPGRLRVFGALPGPPPTFDEGLYVSATTFIGQQLVVSDLRGERTNAARCAIPADANPEGTTFMLSTSNLEAITAVDIVGPDGRAERLPRSEYFTTTGSSVFTLRTPRPTGASLYVHFDRSDRPSVAVAGLDVRDQACRGPGAQTPIPEMADCRPALEGESRKGAVLYFENVRAAGGGLRCGDRPGIPVPSTSDGSD